MFTRAVTGGAVSSLRAPAPPPRSVVGDSARAADDFEQEFGVDNQPESASTALLDPDRRPPLLQASLQQDQAVLEVVSKLGQLERRVEADLPIAELDPAFLVVLSEQRPQQPAGDSFDQIVPIEEGAAVDLEIADPQESLQALRTNRAPLPGRTDV